MKKSIDAVITWVDGYDETYQQQLTAYLNTLDRDKHPSESLAATRFNQQGELDYCVHSLLRFAPWLRKVFIITDRQTPAIMQQFANTPYADKIYLIDHREIFSEFEQFLPTFNSLSIESVLWRIKGISEHFIYFNDDCFLIRPVSPENFFCGQQVIARGCWKIQAEKKWFNFLKRLQQKTTSDIHRRVQENSAKLAGWHRHFFHLPHIPFPLKKSTLEHFFQQNHHLLTENLCHRLRNQQQFWAISVAQHLEIKKNNVIFDNTPAAITINPNYHNLRTIKRKLALADKKQQISFMCMQSLDTASQAIKSMLFEWLDKRIYLQNKDKPLTLNGLKK